MALSKPRKRKCQHCKEPFDPFNSFQKTCMNYQCMIAVGYKLIEKERKREHKKLKEAVRPLKWYADRARDEFNKYIRLRDILDGCISCDLPFSWSGQWHASHYRPAGNNSLLRYDESNVHKSCSICNTHKSGNLSEYRIRLIKKIGLAKVEELENTRVPKRWAKEELIEIRQYYKQKTKELIKFTEEL